ncbi:MAG: hypothetical protein CSA89_01585 [Bacteroidales bacterium]|nr:MAG: hypothetical protein CSA89_01585 [Bacteroidales bacterium]
MSDYNLKNHWIVITNPRAGKNHLAKQCKYILERLNDENIPHTFIITEYAGHAIEIAKENALYGYRNFLVLGGDGTINEIVNGIFLSGINDTKNIILGLIPRGTGNDWGRFWGIRQNDKVAFETFIQGKTSLIDIGKITITNNEKKDEHYFINSIGFGLDAKITAITNRLKKIFGGFSIIYTVALLLAVFRYKSTKTAVTIDNNTHIISLFTMNIANGPYSGGGIKQNPQAIPNDGIFDMMFAERPSIKDILSVLPNIFNGKITENKVIKSFKATNISIRANKGLLAETDGINIDNAHSSDIVIIPQAIQMIVP